MAQRERGHPELVHGSTLRLSIGDIRVALMAGDPGLKPAVQGAARRFVVPGGEPDATVRAAWGDLHEPAEGVPIFDSGALWKLYRRDGNYIFCFSSPSCGPLPYKKARFNADFTSGEISLHRAYFDRSRPAYPLEYPLDELWMVHLLAQGRGVEVHACGVQDTEGLGQLFLGQSRAGKTTMARLMEKAGGIRILSDDRIILRHLDGKIWIYGTPWHGEGTLSTAARAPLKRVFLLGRGRKNEVIPLGQPAAVARLMACSFVPFYSSAGLDFTLAFFQQMARDIPCNELRFVPDGRVVEFLQRLAC